MKQFLVEGDVVRAQQFHGLWTGDGTEILSWLERDGTWDGPTATLLIYADSAVVEVKQNDYVVLDDEGGIHRVAEDIFMATHIPL